MVCCAWIPRKRGLPTLIWMDLEGDPQTYGEELVKLFGISPLTLEMLQEQRERARFAEGEGY